MAIQNQGFSLEDACFSAVKLFARVNIAGYAVKAVHGMNKKVSTCANVAFSQVNSLFPHQTLEGGAVLFNTPTHTITETCMVFCRNTPEAVEKMGLFQKTIDCSTVGISTAGLRPNICYKACSNALTVLKGVAIVSAIDAVVEAVLDRLVQGKTVKHKALKLAIGGAIGAACAWNIIPIVAGISATDALTVYGASRGAFEALWQMGSMLVRGCYAPADEEAAQGAQRAAPRESGAAPLGTRHVQPQPQRRIKHKRR